MHVIVAMLLRPRRSMCINLAASRFLQQGIKEIETNSGATLFEKRRAVSPVWSAFI